LLLLNTQGGKAGAQPRLGEWRLLADPTMHHASLGEGDLLAVSLGGHEIHRSGQHVVFGFHHNRAARLKALRWVNGEASDTYQSNVRELLVEGSMETPVGPWTAIGSFDLSAADGKGGVFETELPEEPWARFVRLSWPKAEENRRTREPQSIHLMESEAGAGYRSILGEWGGGTPAAFLEFQAGTTADAADFSALRVDSARDRPFPLQRESWQDSVVWVDAGWEDWYALPAVSHRSRLEVQIECPPFLKASARLFDGNGKPVPCESRKQGSSQLSVLFVAQPGVDYRLHVFEPKRSVVYLWDVSGSMSRFVESISNAVLEFARGLNPHSEQVLLLPFDEPVKFLSEDWLSDPMKLQQMVRHYDAPDSSHAHLNLIAALERLKKQEGTRAAIVITDCESSRVHNEKLWEVLHEVRPAVFSFHTSDQTAHYGVEQDDMQDWASVAGGFYHQTRAPLELDTAFARVQASLRRPAAYRVRLLEPELSPSTLAVLDARDPNAIKDPSREGLMLIADVSASMRAVMADGRTKAVAAKQVIEDLLRHALPEGVHFGMRVFGHRGGKDCESELWMPLGPLNPEVAVARLAELRSSSLGNTALAESLGKVREDLSAFEGKKRVVVLTDGEETCRGDVAAVIQSLAGEGLDVVVNLVGFTLESADAKQRYANWMQATGGRYYDAADVEALSQALREALTPDVLPAFRVVDDLGKVVAEGMVGDAPMTLDSGHYRVEILDPTGTQVHEVDAFESELRIAYKGPR
jgi:Mg-chelatase subunit ChlD